MKRLFLVILFALISCESDQPQITKYVSIEDTTRIDLVKNLYDLQKQLGNIETKDSMLQSALQEKHKYVDSLIIKTLDYKESKLDLVILNNKYDKVVEEKNIIVQKVDSIHKEYVKLYGENYELKEELNNEKQYNSYLSNENKKLKNKVDKASSLFLTGIKFVGVGETGNGLFNKSKNYETNKSSKIKYVKVTCVLPPNELALKGEKKIEVYLYGISRQKSISQEEIVNYKGEEIILNFKLNVPAPAIEPGKHKALVFLNGKIQYDSDFIVVE